MTEPRRFTAADFDAMAASCRTWVAEDDPRSYAVALTQAAQAERTLAALRAWLQNRQQESQRRYEAMADTPGMNMSASYADGICNTCILVLAELDRLSAQPPAERKQP